MTAFDPVAFGAAVITLVDAIAGLNVYDAEVPATPPFDGDGRVHPYAVVYTGAAAADRSAVGGPVSSYDWTFQVTVVGGDRQRCAWAAEHVIAALVDQRLTVTGFVTGRIVHLPGPGISRDDVENPPRHYQPLMFGLFTASTS